MSLQHPDAVPARMRQEWSATANRQVLLVWQHTTGKMVQIWSLAEGTFEGFSPKWRGKNESAVASAFICVSVRLMAGSRTSSLNRSQLSGVRSRPPSDRTSNSTSKRIRVTFRRASRFSNWPIVRQNFLKSSQAVRNADCSISYYRTRLGATANSGSNFANPLISLHLGRQN